MASWLASHVGVSLITARQYVHVAHALQEYPLLNAEFAAGRLSYSRVRAVIRCVSPGTEEAMVSMAKHATASQMERFAAGVDRVRRRANPGDDLSGWEKRELHLVLQEDGTWILRGRLPAEVGVALKRALDTEVDAQRTAFVGDAAASGDGSGDGSGNTPSDTSGAKGLEPVERRRVDALDAVIKRGHQRCESVDDESSGGVRTLVVVHRYPDGNELEGGPAISDMTADRLECDADVIEAIHRDPGDQPARACNSCGDQRDQRDQRGDLVGPQIRFNRKARRTPTMTMRRWLMDRDQGCRFNGCGRKGKLHAHHVIEYRNGGRTTTKNLVMLCDFHHRAVHNHGWVITGDPAGRLTFARPGLTPPKPVDGDIEQLVANICGPISPTLHGDRFDLNYIVSVFLDAQDHETRTTTARTTTSDPIPTGVSNTPQSTTSLDR